VYRIDESIGRYRVIALLGRGGMGAVYRCVDTALERTVAIKAPHPHLAADAEFRRRFLREARALAAVDAHEGVVRVLGLDHDDDGVPLLVMEHLVGETLQQRIDRAPRRHLDPEEAGGVALQCLDALAFLHARGVMHRDLKPSNVMLLDGPDGRPRARLIDFGLARTPGVGPPDTASGQRLGTPGFMPPEQARGARDLDARADLYALGATLYHALSGALPHDAEGEAAQLVALATGAPFVPLSERRPELPDDIVAVVHRALAHRPEDRFADAAEFSLALHRCAGLRDVSPPVSLARGNDARPSRGARLWPRRLTLAVGGVGVLLAVLAPLSSRPKATRATETVPLAGSRTSLAEAESPATARPPVADTASTAPRGEPRSRPSRRVAARPRARPPSAAQAADAAAPRRLIPQGDALGRVPFLQGGAP